MAILAIMKRKTFAPSSDASVDQEEKTNLICNACPGESLCHMVQTLLRMPYNTAKKHFSRKTEVQTHTVWLSHPHVALWLPCCVFLSAHGTLLPPPAHWTLLLPPLALHPSLLPVVASLWLPLTPSRHTHTSSSFSFFFSLISQGSTPVLLLFLLTVYFASGFPPSPAQQLHLFLCLPL